MSENKLKSPQYLLYITLIITAIIFLIPFYWMLTSSIKPQQDILTIPIQLIPQQPTLENYRSLFSETLFLRSFFNTIFVAGINILVQVILCSMAGFAFAKYQFVGQHILFVLVLGSVMIPVTVQLVPNYLIMSRLGWLDTWLPLIVPTAANAFGVFWMRQYMYSLPDEILDAARLDGASEFGLFWWMVIPLSRPALIALALFVFTSSWNEFLLPLVYLRSPELYTVQLTISNLFRTNFQQNFHLLMSASTLSILPMMLLFIVAQRQFIAGLTLGQLPDNI